MSTVSVEESARTSPVPVLFAHFGKDWIRGSERCLLDLIAHLDPTRFAPVVLCNSPAVASAASAHAVSVLCDARFQGADAFFPDRQLVAEAWRIVQQHRIRLIHVNYPDLVKWLLPAARTARVPLLLHVHLPSTSYERCYSWAHQTTLVVGVSRSVAQEFIDDGLTPDRVSVIYNAVDPQRLNAGDATTLRGQLGIHADEVVIVAVASLIHRKGFDILLKAFAQIATGRTRSRLLIVGDGPDRTQLPALAGQLGVSNTVHFLGERDDVGAIYRDAANVAVSASRQETFGLTLIEAALFGLPVAATAIPAHLEAVEDQKTGLLATPEDPNGLAAVLNQLVFDADLRRRLGDAGRRRVCHSFLVDRYVQQFTETYEKLLERPRRTYGWFGRWAWPKSYRHWTKDAILRRLPRAVPTAKH